ncbi:MAG: thiamine pyrophosphate-binding protein [Solirubrobacterales bacterium]|nr:thiamine pyrophosphate-binding protein [Solirubrobacterales bacterium]
MGLTGGEFVAEYLIAEGVPYLFGIPGHGDMAAFDAFKDRSDRIQVIGPRHEQAAAHMADAYYRASGKPLATMTSIGPGSMNVATGLSTAFVDSIPLISFTGGPQTYMLGRGVLQELERQQDNVFPHIIQPMVKRNWDVQHVDLLADVLPRAFNTMLSGRPGPVHVELPMDVQANVTDLAVPDPSSRRATSGAVRPDPDTIDKAAARLLKAERPVLLAGGGCLEAEAAAEVRKVAEYLDAAVVVTMMGKGVFPEDHPLDAEHTGANGTLVGNHMTRNADVILAVGTRFAEQTSSSYMDGMSFSVPPTEIIHLDIDPTEIGKNYPTAIGAVCDAKAGLNDLYDALVDHNGSEGVDRPAYREEIAKLRAEWKEMLTGRWTGKLSLSQVLHKSREVLPREAIAIASAGHPQIQAFQEFLSYEPRTWLSPGGYSTMGYTMPAAIGAKLARPDVPVVGFAGDGDLQQTIQELAVAAETGAAVIIACLNNTGWISIRDFQRGMFGEDRGFSTEFRSRKGDQLMPVDFCKIAEAYNCGSEKVTEPGEIGPAFERAMASEGPCLIEFELSSEPADSEGVNIGHWDLPKPAYLP